MFPSTPPSRLYQEHEERVAAAVLRYTRKTQAQPLQRRGRTRWRPIPRWLSTLHTQVMRHHVAEAETEALV